ncbi:MAG: hypothetical protein K2G85_03440 [Muribaculaceae bacterium]|nr:hypothetical protein [Muribaculaceae bacterium]
MKLNKYISFGAVALIAITGFSSCDSKNDPAYIPAGPVNDNQRVFFAKNAYTQIVTEEETSFDFLVYRPDLNILDDNGNATTEMPSQTVSIASFCAESGVLGGLINLPSEVTFEVGSPFAVLKVTYDSSQMQPNHIYPIVLTIDPEYGNEYALTQTTLNINKEDYTEWAPFIVGEETKERNGTGYYNFAQIFGKIEDPVQVIYRYVPTNPDDIQFEFQWLLDSENPDLGWETFMTAYTEDGGKIVHVEPQVFLTDPDFGEIYVSDTYTYTGNDKYKGLTKFNPVTGLFTLNLYYFNEEYQFGLGDEFLQLNGYADTNEYSLSVSSQGQIEIEGKDYAIVSFDFSKDITYVDYTVVEGELNEDAVNAVIEKISDPEQTEYSISTLEKSQNVSFTFPSSGEYTVVAVGYNVGNDGKAEAKCTASTSFSFTTFDPFAGWTTVTKDGVFTDYLISYLYEEDEPIELTVQVDKSDEFEGLYRISNPYAVFADQIPLAKFGCIQFEMIDEDHVNFPLSDTGIIINGSNIQIMSLANYYMMSGYEASEIPAPYWGTFKDNKITLNAINEEDDTSFLLLLGTKIYDFDYDFALDLGQSSAKKSQSKQLTNVISRKMVPANRVIMPSKAFYKAAPQGVTSAKFDRKTVKSFKRLR